MDICELVRRERILFLCCNTAQCQRKRARLLRVGRTGARHCVAAPGGRDPAMPGPVRQSGGRHRTPAQKPYERPRSDGNGATRAGNGGGVAEAPRQVMGAGRQCAGTPGVSVSVLAASAQA